MSSSAFQLFEHQVPDLPETRKWTDLLRWMICVMDNDDRALPFIAGVYSYALNNDGKLTEKQSLVANRALGRIVNQWRADTLVCQNMQYPDTPETIGDPDISKMKTKGTA